MKDEYPRPLYTSFNENDKQRMHLPENQDKLLCIMADGGTKEQTQVKLELLLGKRAKTEDQIVVEESIRKLIRAIFDEAGKNAAMESNGNRILQKLAVTNKIHTASEYLKEGSENIKEAQKIANEWCISWNIIKQEEFERALSIYRDSKQQ